MLWKYKYEKLLGFVIVICIGEGMAYVRKYYGYVEASRQKDNPDIELMQEVQQQILLYKECTNKKL